MAYIAHGLNPNGHKAILLNIDIEMARSNFNRLRENRINQVLRLMALSLWLLLLSACEGGTTYTKTIENKSTEEVRLKVYTSLAPTGQEKSVNPGSTAEIYWQDDMGRFADATYDCLNDVDSIIIELSGDKKIHKDIMNPGEWYRRSRSGRNSREDCLFTISDQDVY